MRAALLVVLISGAARSAPPPTPIEIGALVAAETLLLIDMNQTLRMRWLNENLYPAEVHWEGYRELNPLLGPHPSYPVIVGYFVGTMLATGAIWYFVPQTRLLLPGGVLAIEVPMVAMNHQHGLGLGFSGFF